MSKLNWTLQFLEHHEFHTLYDCAVRDADLIVDTKRDDTVEDGSL